jgi:hypothetical protein
MGRGGGRGRGAWWGSGCVPGVPLQLRLRLRLLRRLRLRLRLECSHLHRPLQLRGRLQCSAPPRVAARQRPCIKALQRAAAWLLMRLRVVLGLRSRLIGLGGRRRCGAADPSHSD